MKQNWMKRLLCLMLVGVTVLGMGLPLRASAAAKTVTVPSPADYFGAVVDTDTGEKYTAYYFEGFGTFPKSKINNYVKALNKIGITTKSTYGNGTILNMAYGGEEKMQIAWHQDQKWKGGGYLRVNVVKPLEIRSSASDNTTANNTVSGKTEAKPSILALVRECFGNGSKKVGGNDDYQSTYQFDASGYPEAKVTKFTDALKKMGMKCYITSFSSNGGSKTISIYDDVGGSLITGKWAKKTGTMTITLNWEYIKKSGKFDEKDIPEEPAPEPAPAPYGKQCGSCGGDGKCWDCRGKGVKTRWSGTVKRYITEDCRSCYRAGKCRTCSGDGYLD